jgi:hypothetical protein
MINTYVKRKFQEALASLLFILALLAPAFIYILLTDAHPTYASSILGLLIMLFWAACLFIGLGFSAKSRARAD